MNRVARSQGMTIAGIIWGIVVFFVIKLIEQPPYWISVLGGVAVFLVAFLFRNISGRSIGSDGDELVIFDGELEMRYHKDRILCYKISKITSYSLQIALVDDDDVSFPIEGFSSDRSIAKVFDSLGIRRG